MPPPLTSLGIIHTAFAFAALFSGLIALIRHKQISPPDRSGMVYIVTTAITAATSLGIYQHGGFGFQHILGVLTLLGLAVGMLAARTKIFGDSSRYVQAVGFSSTIMLHMLPGVTETLTRLPPGDPIVTSYAEPTLIIALLLVLVAFAVGLRLQLRWLRGTSSSSSQ